MKFTIDLYGVFTLLSFSLCWVFHFVAFFTLIDDGVSTILVWHFVMKFQHVLVKKPNSKLLFTFGTCSWEMFQKKQEPLGRTVWTLHAQLREKFWKCILKKRWLGIFKCICSFFLFKQVRDVFSRLVRWNNVSVKNSSANNFGTLLFWWNWKLIADKKKIKRVYVYGKWLFHFETSSKKNEHKRRFRKFQST